MAYNKLINHSLKKFTCILLLFSLFFNTCFSITYGLSSPISDSLFDHVKQKSVIDNLLPPGIEHFRPIKTQDIESDIKKENRAKTKKAYTKKSTKSTNPVTRDAVEQKTFSNWGSFMAWMPYQAITDPSSLQYQIQSSAVTGKYGIRMIDDYYIIATGSYYGNVGDLLRVTMSDGSSFIALKGDQKADVDTDADNRVCLHNNSLIEFIVDPDTLDEEAKLTGSFHYKSEFSSGICSIEVIKKYF